jgi:predicted DsbA family dithiol-disulfide isomerase
MASSKPVIEVDVYSDLACPWCYVGHRKLDAAKTKISAQADVKPAWHAFLLDPLYHTNNPRGEPLEPFYVAKFGKERGEAIKARLKEAGAPYGAEFADWQFRSNTFPGHRLVALARQKGLSHEANLALFRRAYEQGQNISDPEVLIDAGKELGLAEVEEWINGDGGSLEVLQDHDVAKSKLQVTGVPAFFIRSGSSKTYFLSGAQPVEVFEEAFQRVLKEGK